MRSIAVIAGVLGRAGEIGQRRRKKDAEAGIVAWLNPSDVVKYIELENERLEEEALTQAEQAKAAKDTSDPYADLLGDEEMADLKRDMETSSELLMLMGRTPRLNNGAMAKLRKEMQANPELFNELDANPELLNEMGLTGGLKLNDGDIAKLRKEMEAGQGRPRTDKVG